MDYAERMPPSMNRRYWRSYLYLLPAAVIGSLIVQAANLGSGWLLVFGVALVAASAMHVTRPRASEEEEYEQFAREHGLPYPPVPRWRLRRR